MSRRSFLVGATLLAASTTGACTAAGPTPVLSMAAGEEGGFYLEFAQLLVRRLVSDGVPAAVMRTGGSVENIEAVRDGTAEIGLALADIASSALTGGSPPFTAPLPLLALGCVYENYVQLVVRAEEPIASVRDLAGRPVSLGAEGSGVAVFGERLLAAAGVEVLADRRPLLDAIDALEQGRVDALLWSGGIPTPALAALAARRPVRLLPLAVELPALRADFGGDYRLVTVPGTVYRSSTVQTVGVSNLLLCRADLPDAVAATIVRTLVTAAPDLVPAPAVGAQYLDQHSLIVTSGTPLHPGAVTAYRALHG